MSLLRLTRAASRHDRRVRVIFKVLSPETVLSISGRFFNNYYDTGSLSIRDQQHGSRRLRRMHRLRSGGESTNCTMFVEWD